MEPQGHGPGSVQILLADLKSGRLAAEDVPGALALAEKYANPVYYRLWGDRADRFGFADLATAFYRLTQNPTILKDMDEILA